MTVTSSQSSVAQLVPVMAVFALLFAALLFWCFLSSCMGMSIRRSLSNLWEYTVLGATTYQGTGLGARGRVPYGEEEIWEMQHRRRT